jgi:hypothetical protein
MLKCVLNSVYKLCIYKAKTTKITLKKILYYKKE